MKHRHPADDRHRPATHATPHGHRRQRPQADGENASPFSHRGHGRGFRRGGRPFDNGELRLVMLQMIAEAPRHGYELIKAIEDRMGGGYSPSPGVIYPTLAMLEELGHVSVDATSGGRKRHTLTPEGQDFLDANRPAVTSIFVRMDPDGPQSRGTPAPIVRAMENLKTALRLKLSATARDSAQIGTIAAALDEAALLIERAEPAAVPPAD